MAIKFTPVAEDAGKRVITKGIEPVITKPPVITPSHSIVITDDGEPTVFQIRIGSELKKAFLQKAQTNGTTAAELIRDFMRSYVDK